MTAKARELLRKAQVLSIDQRLRLAEAIHDSAQAGVSGEPLKDWQLRELERRLEDDDRNPDDVVPWNEARTKLTKAISRRK